MTWNTVIGLEVHAQLLTSSKAFCGCSTSFAAPPNTNVCPVCLGYPGALPVLNGRVAELAIAMALATGAVVHRRSVFSRKNYFYPDLAKGYQITQHEEPIATGGSLAFRDGSGSKSVDIRRIHIEEDAGKLVHDLRPNATLVDFNRAGVPLIEIVSEPQLHSSEEAIAYLTRLRQIVMYAGVCDGNMDQGSLRCDANISVNRADEPLGTRVEVKNLNSFRFLGRAVDFEVARQIALLEQGQTIVQETRLFDVPSGETRSMRTKEDAHDYRYFPEPDLPPLIVTESMIESARTRLPELPHDKAERYRRELGIDPDDAEVLVASRDVAEYFERVATDSRQPRAAANWVRNEVLGVLNARKIDLSSFRLAAQSLAKLIAMIESGEIGGKVAKEVFERASSTGEEPAAIVAAEGLGQISDRAELEKLVDAVLAEHHQELQQCRAGKTGLFGFFVGTVMKKSRGRANAAIVNELLRARLDRRE